jgi:hypothetical protein
MPVTPERLAHNGTEDNHQAALFCWSALPEQQTKYPEFKYLLFAIPNGGERHIAVAAKMKATGTKAGTADIFLSVPRGGYHGLYIELKKVGGRASKEQAAFLMEAKAEGFAGYVCVGWEQARDLLIWYMALPTLR